MGKTSPREQITIRHDLRPGDLGYVTYLHGVHYAREWGLDTSFEPYVARPLAEFVLAGPHAGRLWIAERGASIVGSVALLKADAGVGQLRWFLVIPDGRGPRSWPNPPPERTRLRARRRARQNFLVEIRRTFSRKPPLPAGGLPGDGVQ